MYRMIIIYLDGTLQGMEISQSTSVQLEVGKSTRHLSAEVTTRYYQ